MQLTGYTELLRGTSHYRDLLARLRTGDALPDLGVLRAARPFLLAALAADWGAPVLYLTAQIKNAYNAAEQLPVWLAEDSHIKRFAESATAFYERGLWGENVIRARIETLAALLPPEDVAVHPAPVIITSARALMQRTMPVPAFRRGSMLLRVGERLQLDRLLAQWVALGYEPATLVTMPGVFSRRGGIVDIFPLAADLPVRVEFWGDEIDSLRSFDPATQRTIQSVSHVGITPAREALPDNAPQVAVHLREWFTSLNTTEDDPGTPLADADSLANGAAFPFIEHYLPYLYPDPVSLLDYAPTDALVVLEDRDELRAAVEDIEQQAQQTRAAQQAKQHIAPDHPLPYLTWEQLTAAFAERPVLNLGRGEGHGGTARPAALGDLFVPARRFGGQLKPLLNHARELRQDAGRIAIVTAQAARLAELWSEQESFVPQSESVLSLPEPGTVIFINGTLSEGWQFRAPDGTMQLYTDAEVFGWSRPEPRRRKSAARRARTPEAHYADWQTGDYVVHVDYGIGRFAGMRRRTIEATEREYLLVEYAGTDMLFVPIHQADRLTRYVGVDDKPPALTRLGQPEWTRVRSKARHAILTEARELYELYSQRASVPGYAFVPDNHWQHEMEASFPFVETDDQLTAVRQVKHDMESAQPMDRLICGDVGFGKTEVAIRAAFKAVMSGKQVAVLVPTTVLAQQHYETFSQRLGAFPVVVEALSRFRSKEEQNRVLPRIASGEVDVLIGTHRILSEDITFHDLGLVIIDEEQRFGVKHKEHFKKLRTQVDVLTLTATPIPRTLYMSMAGIRDISMIQTPPEERLPVMTQVGVFDEQLVRQAVLRELERGGQVFYVHNRVQTIETARERLEQIVPEARTVVAHGQMPPRHLENVMAAFAHGEYDVLVSTSIIESGIDIPNANTLIIDRADWFGMAQLYQLRGRVGRSAQQAYAYFFHPHTNRLTEEARARLETLAENTALGSGLQIAVRDLELRGAGDILSTRQTGQVAAVGLYLYTQMLTEAIQEIKGRLEGEPLPPSANEGIVIDLPIPAYLPADWIPEMALRLQMYRRIASLTRREDVAHMREELRDRFGALPPAVEGLLYQIEVKLLAQKIHATAVVKPREHILIKLSYLAGVDRRVLAQRLNSHGTQDVEVSRTAVELLVVPELWQARLLQLLEQLGSGVGSLQIRV